MAGDARQRQELRGHGARAHRRHTHLAAAQLLIQSHGEGGDISLGGGIDRHPGIGAERGDGGDI